MSRNLVLIHLESLNNFTYKMNPDFFPFIRKIEKNSVSFGKYFSTATSTLMTLADIYYGGMEQYEQCTSLAYVPQDYPYKTSLFDDLKDKGYGTGLFVYPDGNDRDTAEQRHIAGFNNEMVLKENYKQYLAAINEIVKETPFALSLCNYISNMTYNHYTDKTGCMTGRETWEEGFRALDRSVEDIFNILEKRNVLDNTTVILYGDHGDDYWVHKAKGRTHPIEPYTNLIHTPMMIYDVRLEPRYREELVSSIDLRNMVENLLCEKLCGEYLGSRNMAISRILYAAQPVSVASMRKSYSITDGEVLLLVSEDGFEMYDIEMDPLCTNNLLYPFDYEREDEVLKFVRERYLYGSYQYRDLMTRRELRYIRQRFYYLKVRLYDEVKRLYLAANLTEAQMTEEMKFDRIRYVNNIEEE